MEERQTKLGLTNGISAYLIWGFLPIYWKLLESYDAFIVFSHRIVWSFVFILLLIIISKQWTTFRYEWKRATRNLRTFSLLLCISLLISMNWLIFIWAVQHGYVIQTSLGYYMNPLINIVLGLVFLKESLTKAQSIACIIAFIAVAFLTVYYGVFPWISLSLACTFALYGLLKKIIHMHAVFGLAIETIFIVPFVLIYFLWTDHPILMTTSGMLSENILLLFSGVATAVPLLLFSSAIKYLPYATIGFLQYIAPTIMLFIGVFLYKETFTYAHAITFSLIWFALILYMTANYREFRKIQRIKMNS